MKNKPMANTDSPRHDTMYHFGIALSGGGARGIAHAGALKALEECGLRPDVIAGVSAGAVIAVMYAGGVSPEAMLELFEGMSFSNMVEFRLGGGGLFKIDKFKRKILHSISPAKNLEDLRVPVYIGATDLDNGRSEYFTEGQIGDRVIASCSIPVLFKPVKINGVNYVDGGVLRNLPARVLRDKCQKLIGINVSPMTPYKKTSNSVIDVAMRSYNLMSRHNQEEDQELCDVAIEMRDISAYGVFNLKDIEKVFNSGYVNTRAALRKSGWWPSRHK